ncbi:MAG: hypothetical protein Nk1A_7880 [Endomicrobiia bacterium]|nr:MAG: hypothetical protein Nk1A_7880 [Endomicrobiia bacterium]
MMDYVRQGRTQEILDSIDKITSSNRFGFTT